MELYYILLLIALGILLLLSAFFSASETALMSLSRIRIAHMVEERVRGADTIDRLRENPSKLLGTILVGNNVANIAASSIATVVAIEYFGDTGAGIATGIMTILVLIFAEITPKALAAQYSEKISVIVARPVNFLTIFLNPIVNVFTQISSILIRLMGGKTGSSEPFITEEELKTIVSMSEEEGIIEDEEKKMIVNVFEFGDQLIKDVMIQRTDIVAININSTYDEVVELLKTEQYSRYPVYNNRIDNIVGIFNIKEMVFYKDIKENFDLKKLMRKPYYTFEFKKVSELFNEMKKLHVHMAIVLDEYGGTAGIVTIEDLIEEIVGDISDEYDPQVNEIETIREGEYIVDGSTRIDLLNEMIGTKLESEYYDTIGGFIIGEIGRLPQQGESIEYERSRFVVENMERNRIKKIRILMSEAT